MSSSVLILALKLVLKLSIFKLPAKLWPENFNNNNEISENKKKWEQNQAEKQKKRKEISNDAWNKMRSDGMLVCNFQTRTLKLSELGDTSDLSICQKSLRGRTNDSQLFCVWIA